MPLKLVFANILQLGISVERLRVTPLIGCCLCIAHVWLRAWHVLNNIRSQQAMHILEWRKVSVIVASGRQPGQGRN
jgi:hypothetical protein